MTLLIVDPALLIDSDPLTDHDEGRVTAALRNISIICKKTGARIPRAQPYWNAFQKELALPLSKRARSEELRAALDYLREVSVEVSWPLASGKYWLWNVRPLYEWVGAPESRRTALSSWTERMGDVIGRCIDSGEERVFFAVRFEMGRNCDVFGSGVTQIEDKVRHRVRIQKTGCTPLVVPCVQNHRNVLVEWTRRYDDRLPCKSDGSTHPFCPVDQWWKRSITIAKTHKSKPAYIDRIDNAWARPGTPNGKHWDVYIQDSILQQSAGLSQVNVRQWNEVGCGRIDHVPKKKKSRGTGGSGWNC